MNIRTTVKEKFENIVKKTYKFQQKSSRMQEYQVYMVRNKDSFKCSNNDKTTEIDLSCYMIQLKTNFICKQEFHKARKIQTSKD